MTEVIDLRSDTVTRPSEGMRVAMMNAPVGDDCYGDDPSVNELERYSAELFGKEAAVFTTSGTMSNQIALRAHTNPGDEVLVEESYHIHYFESAPSSDLARIALHPRKTSDGVLQVQDIKNAVDEKPRGPYYSNARLVCLENTINCRGGKVYPFETLDSVHRYCVKNKIAIHMDGARIFNASVATGIPVVEYASKVDTLSTCFAKGLGAPFGSVLVGSAEVIDKARKYRKWYGGGLHQSGFMAAAALYSLKNNIVRLGEDHMLAKLFGASLAESGRFSIDSDSIETNFALFDVSNLGVSPKYFVESAERIGVRLFPWTEGMVRASFHQDVGITQASEAAKRLISLADTISGKIRPLNKVGQVKKIRDAARA